MDQQPFSTDQQQPPQEFQASAPPVPTPTTMSQEFQPSPSQPLAQMDYGQPKKSNTGIIIAIVVSVLIVAIAIVAVLFVFNKSDDTGKKSDETSTTQTKPTSKVKYKGFTLSIPTDYIYEVIGDKLAIGDEAETWASQIELGEASYTKVVAKKDLLESQYIKLGLSIANTTEKTYGGTKFLTMEFTKGGESGLLAISRATASQIFVAVSQNATSTIDYSIIENIAPILTGAVYEGDSMNAKFGVDIDTSLVESIAK